MSLIKAPLAVISSGFGMGEEESEKRRNGTSGWEYRTNW